MILHNVDLCGYDAVPTQLRLGTDGSYGVEYLQLKFGGSWDGLAVIATFTAPDGTPTDAVADSDGLVKVPPEATCHGSGCGVIVLRGCRDGVQLISCNMGYFITAHGPVNGSESTEPTPDKWQQFVDEVQDDREAADKAARDAAASADRAEQAANSNGYAAMEIDKEGHLIVYRTDSLEDKLSFAIVGDTNLEVTIHD